MIGNEDVVGSDPETIIWTLQARDSVLLEVMTSHFSLSETQVRREIVDAHSEVTRVLTSVGINYQHLQGALTPQRERQERAYLFDTAKIENNWYGYEVSDRLIPALDPRVNCSIMCGDLITDNQDRAFALLEEHVTLHKSVDLQHSSQVYCIYVNNLTPRLAEDLHQALVAYDPYIGFVDCTFSSAMKNWLSVTLVHEYVKAGRVVMCTNEDGSEEMGHVNVPGWPFEEHGYRCLSTPAMLFELFLSYKIERAVYPGFESDSRFALNAISDSPHDIAEFKVEVDEAKVEYLRRAKASSLGRAGLSDVSAEKLQELIGRKIKDNYIYRMRFNPEFDLSSFNIMLEVQQAQGIPTRLLAALAYEPDREKLRLVTLY